MSLRESWEPLLQSPCPSLHLLWLPMPVSVQTHSLRGGKGGDEHEKQPSQSRSRNAWQGYSSHGCVFAPFLGLHGLWMTLHKAQRHCSNNALYAGAPGM